MLQSVTRPVFGRPGCGRSTRHLLRHLAPTYARKSSRVADELAAMSNEKLVEKLPTVTNLEWNSPLQVSSILKYPHPKLRATNSMVGVFGEPLKKLTDELFNVMYDDEGCGLAAPQVGVNMRLMVFNGEGSRDKGTEYVLANPRIYSMNKSTDVFKEGCLSFKLGKDIDIRGDVERPTRIKIKAKDVNGKTIRLELDGWEARVFQHEFDHLDGILMHDHFTSEELENTRDKLEVMEQHFIKENPGVEVQCIAPVLH